MNIEADNKTKCIKLYNVQRYNTVINLKSIEHNTHSKIK